MRIVKKKDSLKSWHWRLMLGPAQVIDGLVSTFTLTFVSSGLALALARKLAQSRIV